MDGVVSTQWLAAELGKSDLAIFDASLSMPGESQSPRAQFALGHIPGARFFDINDIADPDTDLPHMVPATGRFERLIGALGVGNDTRVVFYDQKGLYSAARGWWLLGLFGHDRVAVLDGGLPKWLREQREIEVGEPPAATPVRYRARLRSQRLRGLGDMLANLDTMRELVIDARSRGRFEGTAPEPRAGLASGHMPGSRNLPFNEVLNADGTLRTAAELHAIFGRLGVDKHTSVVTSCGSGVTATVITLALTVAGFDPGAVYDGSWSEWGAAPGVPVERLTAP